jgi:hypothetical protein
VTPLIILAKMRKSAQIVDTLMTKNPFLAIMTYGYDLSGIPKIGKVLRMFFFCQELQK